MELKRSKDVKVANSLTPSGSARIGNSFGLPSGKAYSCPGATSICESICYAGKLERLRPSVRDVLMYNYSLLREAERDTMINLLNSMVIAFESECEKWSADKKFRIHWDGDFFSMTYTEAWAHVIKSHPNIIFWVYTRNSHSAKFLHSLELANLSLYFSADTENLSTAMELKDMGISIAMLEETFADGKAILPRAAMCPENRKQISLKGACIACNICVKGGKDVLFSIKKR